MIMIVSKLIRFLALFCLWLFCVFTVMGQEGRREFIEGELIIQMHDGVSPKAIISNTNKSYAKLAGLKIEEKLSDRLNIWKYSFDANSISTQQILEELSTQDRIIAGVQRNILLEFRSTTPNDPQFSSQWQHINTGQFQGDTGFDMDTDLAWDLTTGGVTASGDTIVVCIIDSGVDTDHPDLKNNLWINHKEVPNNGIDDDLNGFRDDYRGWDTGNNDDSIEDYENHGTSVSGLIGAEGNNGIGVAGVNWSVKLMQIQPRFLELRVFSTSEAIRTLDYALENRLLYNESQGEKGAFIVAVNASWGGGANTGNNEASLLCNMIESLGQAGIITVAATPNKNVNLDEIQDLPSKCPSEFLIATTNIDNSGRKVTEAAFGENSVDMAAYGGTLEQGTWTTDANGAYRNFGGTSAAAANISGAIGLLYSSSCSTISDLALVDPSATARFMRQYIINGLVANPWLDGLTITGGHLNVNNAVQDLVTNCPACIAVTSVDVDSITDKTASISWINNNTTESVNLRWKAKSETVWNEFIGVQPPFQVTGLSTCTEYEFQIQTICEAERQSYSSSIEFRSEGCCEPPSEFETIVQENLISIEWDTIFGANQYLVRFRLNESMDWVTDTANSNNKIIGNLESCTEVEVQVAAICAGVIGEFSESFFQSN